MTDSYSWFKNQKIEMSFALNYWEGFSRPLKFHRRVFFRAPQCRTYRCGQGAGAFQALGSVTTWAVSSQGLTPSSLGSRQSPKTRGGGGSGDSPPEGSARRRIWRHTCSQSPAPVSAASPKGLMGQGGLSGFDGPRCLACASGHTELSTLPGTVPCYHIIL